MLVLKPESFSVRIYLQRFKATWMNVFTSSLQQQKLVSLSRQTCITAAPAEGDADVTAPPEVQINLCQPVASNRNVSNYCMCTTTSRLFFNVLLRLFEPLHELAGTVSAAASPC